MSNAFPSILLLIPAYNEESRIAPVLEDYAVYFREHHPERFSLVVVLKYILSNLLATALLEPRGGYYPGAALAIQAHNLD